MQGAISDADDLTTDRPQGSSVSLTIVTGLVTIHLTVSLLSSVDILVYVDDLVLANSTGDKSKKPLNKVDKAANNLDLNLWKTSGSGQQL